MNSNNYNSNNQATNKIVDSIGLGEINSQNYPMAVRFLSFSYKHNLTATSTNKYNSGWYSTLYPKSKVNKLLEMIDCQSSSIDNQSTQNKLLPLMTNNTNNFLLSQQYNNNNFSNNNNNSKTSPQQLSQQQMTEKQLFMLPQSLVKFVTTSL